MQENRRLDGHIVLLLLRAYLRESISAKLESGYGSGGVNSCTQVRGSSRGALMRRWLPRMEPLAALQLKDQILWGSKAWNGWQDK
jgi:hypothetical protein